MLLAVMSAMRRNDPYNPLMLDCQELAQYHYPVYEFRLGSVAKNEQLRNVLQLLVSRFSESLPAAVHTFPEAHLRTKPYASLSPIAWYSYTKNLTAKST